MSLAGVIAVDAPPISGDLSAPRGEGALAPVANEPIAAHVLDTLVTAGVERLVVVAPAARDRALLNALEAQAAASALPLDCLVADEPVELPCVLRLAASVVGDAPSVVHSAAGLLGLGPTAPPTLDVARRRATIFVYQGQTDAGHLSAASQQMLKLAELDPRRDALRVAGVWAFGPEALGLAAQAPWEESGGIDLTGVAQRLARAGGGLNVVPVEAWAAYAGDPRDLLELNRIALDRLRGDVRRPVNHGNRYEGRVVVGERASVRSSLIVGPTVIGPRARIVDAYVGPYTSVGCGATIEGAEIERSIVHEGAIVRHVGQRIVSSVIGRQARIEREFTLPRALRLTVGDRAEIVIG